MKMNLQISEKALEKLNKSATGLFIHIVPKGCNGYSYIYKPMSLFYVDDSICVHPKLCFSIELYNLVKDSKNTLEYNKTTFSRSYKFSSSIEEGSCGCGISFNTKEKKWTQINN
jgi:Fe-S cluster assembly iron-binding protein IscA